MTISHWLPDHRCLWCEKFPGGDVHVNIGWVSKILCTLPSFMKFIIWLHNIFLGSRNIVLRMMSDVFFWECFKDFSVTWLLWLLWIKKLKENVAEIEISYSSARLNFPEKWVLRLLKGVEFHVNNMFTSVMQTYRKFVIVRQIIDNAISLKCLFTIVRSSTIFTELINLSIPNYCMRRNSGKYLPNTHRG